MERNHVETFSLSRTHVPDDDNVERVAPKERRVKGQSIDWRPTTKGPIFLRDEAFEPWAALDWLPISEGRCRSDGPANQGPPIGSAADGLPINQEQHLLIFMSQRKCGRLQVWTCWLPSNQSGLAPDWPASRPIRCQSCGREQEPTGGSRSTDVATSFRLWS